MAREMVRQGGRSARIQTAVHTAVKTLLDDVGREALTVPMIAEHAGVPPSTIYRRWGNLADLIADVATERMRPIHDPDETGSLKTDLEQWTLQYLEEMSTDIGRELLGDMFGAVGGEVYAQRCNEYSYRHLLTINARAVDRGEAGFEAADAIDRIIAPIMYHILFTDRPVDADYARRLVAGFLADATQTDRS